VLLGLICGPLAGAVGLGVVWWDSACVAADDAAATNSPLPGNHRLDEVAAGQVLLAELGCARCRAGLPKQVVAVKQASNLAEVGSRVSPEYLQRYLADATAVHRGTTMPDVLGARPPAERKAIGTCRTDFLIAPGESHVP
jgi:hypothetical protein